MKFLINGHGRFFISFLSSIILTINVFGQEEIIATIIEKSYDPTNKQFLINYDISYFDKTQFFEITLEVNYDDKIIIPPKNEVLLDKLVTAGVKKEIKWNVPENLIKFIDKMTFNVVPRKIDAPFADFDFKIINDRPSFELRFFNDSKFADSFIWNFGDPKSEQNNESTDENPVHIYKSTGNYDVKLVVGSDQYGLKDSILKIISVKRSDSSLVQKHKRMKFIWLGSAVIFAGMSGSSYIKAKNLYDEYSVAKEDAKKLRGKCESYSILAPSALVLSGVSITMAIIQMKKQKKGGQKVSYQFIPVDEGFAFNLTLKF
jgi:PKD repeat protein